MAASSTKKEIGRYLIETDESKALFKGNYGVLVCLGKHTFTKQDVVAKRYEVFKDYPQDMLREVRKEAHLMRDIPLHPNTLQILDFQQTDGISEDGEEAIHLWLVLEYCSLGDLKKFAKRTELSFAMKVDLMLQSAKGVKHLHDHGIVHRDLKPQNILVAGTAKAPQIKIADFGESRLIVSTLHTPRGTPPFKAPEMLGSSIRYNSTVDIYSLGCTGYALLGYEQGKSMIPLVAGSFIGTYLRDHPDADLAALIIKEDDNTEEAELKRLLAAMMGFDPSTRPSIQEVIDKLFDLISTDAKQLGGGKRKTRSRSYRHRRRGQKTHVVFVKSMTGKTLAISISLTATVENLKAEIYKREGVSAGEQRLIFAGQQLEDRRSLADYNIQHDSAVYLVLRLVGS